MQIKDQTKKLKEHLEHLKKRFEMNQPPKNLRDQQLFLQMKEETTPIYQLLENWEKHALQLIQERKLKVHPHQIVATKENFELIIPHSYYVDIRRRRYMEINHSIHYIFDQIID